MKPLTIAQRDAMIMAGKCKNQLGIKDNASADSSSINQLHDNVSLNQAMKVAAHVAKRSVYKAAGLKFPQDVGTNPQVELLAREAAQIARQKAQTEFNANQKCV